MKKFKFILLFSLFIALGLIGCRKASSLPKSVTSTFDSFTNDLFLNEIKDDSLTLNYTLSKPENYGIHDFTPTLGEFGSSKIQKDLAFYENAWNLLQTFDYNQLTEEQQLTYDVLSKCLQNELEASNYIYYLETLGPTTGIQAQLPVLLAEYNFYDVKDVKDYIALLKDIPNYFDQIIAFEKEKSQQGLFMSDDTVDDILSQCQTFIENPNENLLIEIFNDRISDYEGLSDEDAATFQTQNKEAVLHSVIPAYETLIRELTALKGTGKNSGGLCHFPNGKAFYELLVKTTTGSNRNMEEINEMLDDAIQKCQSKLSLTLRKYPDAFYEAMSPSYPVKEPEKIIYYLKDAILKDFPSMGDVNCDIKYVHQSLEENINPAFYLTPALDAFTENSIYINNGKMSDTFSLFTTLAHEGYPGHLYQTVYFNQQNPPLIRNVLHFGGYTEGWATYVELYSYSLAGLNEATQILLEQNYITTLCVYAKCELGINYYGWDLNDTTQYLADFGIADDDVASTIYKTMVAEPGSYMKYTLGYLEFTKMREKAETALKEDFVLKEFHEFILKAGPMWFDLLDKQLDDWIRGRQS